MSWESKFVIDRRPIPSGKQIWQREYIMLTTDVCATSGRQDPFQLKGNSHVLSILGLVPY